MAPPRAVVYMLLSAMMLVVPLISFGNDSVVGVAPKCVFDAKSMGFKVMPLPDLPRVRYYCERRDEHCNDVGRRLHLRFVIPLILTFLDAARNNTDFEGQPVLVDLGAGAGAVTVAAAALGSRVLAVDDRLKFRRLIDANICANKEILGTRIHVQERIDGKVPTLAAVHIGSPLTPGSIQWIAAAASSRQPLAFIVGDMDDVEVDELGPLLLSHGYIGYSHLSRNWLVNGSLIRDFQRFDGMHRRASGYARSLVFVRPAALPFFYQAPHQPYTIPLAPPTVQRCMSPDLPQLPLAGFAFKGNVRVACTLNGDAVCGCVRRDGDWEAQIFHLVHHGVTELGKQGRRPLFIDIGGNVGAMAIRMSGSGFLTHVFEMLPRNVQMLHTSRCLNGLEKRLIVHHVGLGDQPKSCIIITAPESNDGIVDCRNRTLAQMHPYTPQGPVVIHRLDDIFGSSGLETLLDEGHVPVVKMDVEGFELRVMQGGSKLLSHPNRPLLIVSEVWKSLDILAFWTLMREYGYVAFGYASASWLLTKEDVDRFSGRIRQLSTVAFMTRKYAQTSFQHTRGQGLQIPPFPQ